MENRDNYPYYESWIEPYLPESRRIENDSEFGSAARQSVHQPERPAVPASPAHYDNDQTAPFDTIAFLNYLDQRDNNFGNERK